MKNTTPTLHSRVSADEAAMRVREYRRLGFEAKAMPHVVYHSPWDICPWPGCGFKIGGIDFQLETSDSADYSRQLAAWWQGGGLVGRCPGCDQLVLFGFDDKRCVSDLEASSLVALPDDWFQRAYTL